MAVCGRMDTYLKKAVIAIMSENLGQCAEKVCTLATKLRESANRLRLALGPESDALLAPVEEVLTVLLEDARAADVQAQKGGDENDGPQYQNDRRVTANGI